MVRFAVAFSLLVGSVLCSAADLSTVHRDIGREPVYQSKVPRYALLVFGAKAESRAWLVVDGDTLYIDRNGNGDLTDPGESVRCSKVQGVAANARQWFDVGDLAPNVSTKYGGVVVSYQLIPQKDKADIHFCRVWLNASFGQHASARMAARRSEAPILHFDGPLTMLSGAAYPAISDGLIRGEECEIGARVGSIGWGTSLRDGQKVIATLFCEPFQNQKGIPRISLKCIPDDVHPVAEIAFPIRVPNRQPVLLRVPLNRRC